MTDLENGGRSHRVRIAAAGVAVTALALAACGGGSSVEEARDVTVRDSAGITIVESGRAPTTPRLVLDTLPELDIGERLDDDPDYQLFQVHGALRMSDGTILVANGGSNQLRFYDAAGEFVRAVGRAGEGPGEFQQLSWIGLAEGDTILTYDFSGRRLSRFTPDGEYVSAVALGGSDMGGFLSPIGLLGDGRVVARGNIMFRSGDARSGISRDSVTLILADTKGAVTDTVGRFPGSENSVSTSGSGQNRGMMVMNVPFGRSLTHAVHEDVIAVAPSDTYEILLLDASGAVRRIIRRRAEPVSVSPDDIEAFRARRLEGMSNMPAQFQSMAEKQLEDAVFPEVMPPYSTVSFDGADRLWVKEASHVGEPSRWAVFDRDGALIAEFQLPERFRPTDIGEDYLLGIARDEMDLERVQLFRLTNADGDAALANAGKQ